MIKVISIINSDENKQKYANSTVVKISLFVQLLMILCVAQLNTSLGCKN